MAEKKEKRAVMAGAQENTGTSGADETAVTSEQIEASGSAVVKIETEEERAAKRYQEVLFRREALKREAHGYYRAYMKEFGVLLTEVYRAEVACIERKKKIRFAQMAANQGHPVDRRSMEFFVEREMTAYRERLKQMKQQTEISQHGTALTPEEVREVKKTYRKLAKWIHPDLHPQFAEDAEARELWERVQAAYQDNDRKALEELETLVGFFLREHALPAELPKIDYEGKIRELKKEIDRILTTRPYIYRRDLLNTEVIENRRDELMKQLKEQQEYAGQLDEVLAQFEYVDGDEPGTSGGPGGAGNPGGSSGSGGDEPPVVPSGGSHIVS